MMFQKRIYSRHGSKLTPVSFYDVEIERFIVTDGCFK